MDEGIFGFSKAIVGDSCPGGLVCHVHVTCCTIPLILTRFWAQGVTAMQLDAIGGVNHDFLKFRGWIEKVVIVEGGKV